MAAHRQYRPSPPVSIALCLVFDRKARSYGQRKEIRPMTPGIRPLVAGNWKMNGTSASLGELIAIGNGFMKGLETETDALVCVPATLLSRARDILKSTPVKAGGQDCHAGESGAHTGDVSAEMLKDAG